MLQTDFLYQTNQRIQFTFFSFFRLIILSTSYIFPRFLGGALLYNTTELKLFNSTQLVNRVRGRLATILNNFRKFRGFPLYQLWLNVSNFWPCSPFRLQSRAQIQQGLFSVVLVTKPISTEESQTISKLRNPVSLQSYQASKIALLESKIIDSIYAHSQTYHLYASVHQTAPRNLRRSSQFEEE